MNFADIYSMGNATKYTKELLESKIAISKNMSDLLRNLGLGPTGGTREFLKKKIKEYGLSTENFSAYSSTGYDRKFSSYKDYFIKTAPNVRISGDKLKAAMVKAGVDYFCSGEDCPSPQPIWRGKKFVLQVDHKDGDYTNNLLENLRFLCPNCHAQTETYSRRKSPKKTYFCECGREIKKGSKQCTDCQRKYKDNNLILSVSKNFPSTEELIKNIEDKGYLSYSTELNISDNGLRKVLIRRGVETLPKKLNKADRIARLKQK